VVGHGNASRAAAAIAMVHSSCISRHQART
jgi:hypothetical protein